MKNRPHAIVTAASKAPSPRAPDAQPSRGGRPSREAAALLSARIVEAATELMLEHGYGATSIEAVAARAGVSKRTFYHRYPDKAALIRAVVGELIDAARPAAGPSGANGGDLGAALRQLGAQVLDAALTPRILALHRLLIAESSRFPELLEAVALSRGRETMVNHLVGLFQARPNLPRQSAEFAATQLLQLWVSLPQMHALGLGETLSAAQRTRWVTDSVALFLGGLDGLASETTPTAREAGPQLEATNP